MDKTKDCKTVKCYNETSKENGYCFDCEYRIREDQQHKEQECMRCEQTFYDNRIVEWCAKCRTNPNRLDM